MTHDTPETGGGTCAPVPYCKRGHAKVLSASSGRWQCRVCAREWWRRRSAEARRVRFKERTKRIAGRPCVARADRVWAAGHFEGEGTISLMSPGRVRNCISRPRVTLSSTDRAVTDFFHATWPGMLQSAVPKSKNGLARRAWRWTLHGHDRIEGFLLDIRPFLKTARVREKADLLIEDIRDRMQMRRTPAARERLRRRMAKLRALNRRGLAPGETA